MDYNSQRSKLTKKELYMMALRSLFIQATFNYERMQACGWVYSLLPALKKVYKNKENFLKEAIKDHLQFFNTHPFLVTPILGIIASMEEKGDNRNTIKNVKLALMGSLGAIGDILIWLILFPLFTGIGIYLSAGSKTLGPILFLILFNIVHFVLIFGGIGYGYKEGLNKILAVKEKIKFIIPLTSALSLTIIVALAVSNMDIKSLKITEKLILAEHNIILSNFFFDLISLIIIFVIYWLLKKGLSSTKMMIFIIIFSIILKYLKIL